LDTFSGTLSGSSRAVLDLESGQISVASFVVPNYTYVTESITYSGIFKGTFFTSKKTGEEAAAVGDPSIIDRIGTTLNGSFQGPGIGKFFYDYWGTAPYISDDNTTAIRLDNGNLLYTIVENSGGAVYPNHGIIVLSGKRLDELGFNTNRSIERNGYNTYRLFHALQLVLDQNLTDLSGDPLGFYGRGINIQHSKLCFVRTMSKELNFSNNPTYVSGSENEIIDPLLKQDKSYFTSIGLYNPNMELLAIGKLSRPVMSSKTEQGLFTVKVTYL
jgi:hypothetical protein